MVSNILIQNWIGALLTFMVLSMLWKENVLFRIAEHIMIGSGIAHVVVSTLYKVIGSGDFYMSEWYVYIPVILLGLMFYTKYTKTYRWMMRYPTALVVGIGTGLVVRTLPKVQIVDQIALTINPLTGSPMAIFTNLIILVGVITGLYYFIFYDKLSTNTVSASIRSVGLTFILISFGVGWATVIVGNGAKFMDRVMFLLYDFIGLVA